MLKNLFGVVIGATLIAAVAPAAANTCVPASTQELQKLLVERSPFVGQWTLGGDTGEVRYDFRERAGVPYVRWRSENERGIAGKTDEFTLRLHGTSGVTIGLGKVGSANVRLMPDCRLTGTRNRSGGNPAVALAPTGSAGSGNQATSKTQWFNTSTENLLYFLTNHSPFEGTWKWSDRRGRLTTTFNDQGDGTLGGVMLFIKSNGDKVRKSIETTILSPSRIRHTVPGWGFSQADVEDDGTLSGILSAGDFAHLFSLRPTVLTAEDRARN